MAAQRGESLEFICNVVLTYEGDECLIWPFARLKGGYAGHRSRSASRFICRKEKGQPPTPKHHAAHSCGNGHLGCVTKSHIFWKTPKENAADKLVHGTHGRGERCWRAKITENDVREIRALKRKVFNRDLAARFGVDQSTISKIQNGKAWAWLPINGGARP